MRSGWGIAARHITGKYGEISECRVISTVKNSADSRKRQTVTVVCLRRSDALHFNSEPPASGHKASQASGSSITT